MPGPSPEVQGHVVVERKGPQTDVCVSGRRCERDLCQGGTGTLTQLRSLPIPPGPQIQSPHNPSSSTVPRRCPWGTVLWEGGLSYGIAGSHTPLHGPAAAALLVPSTACPLLSCEPPTREEHDLSPDSGVEGCPRAPMIHLALGFLRQPSPHTCDVVAVSGPMWLLGGPGSECLLGQLQPGCPSHHWAPKAIQVASGPPSSTQTARRKDAVAEPLSPSCPCSDGRVQPQGVCDPETFLIGASPTLRSPFTTWLHKAEP